MFENLSPKEQREWDAFVQHAREGTVKAMAKSAAVISLVSENELDIKHALETGLAVLMDKPIIAVAIGGRAIPPGLLRVAHAVIEVEEMDTEAGRLELHRKLAPVFRKLGVTGSTE